MIRPSSFGQIRQVDLFGAATLVEQRAHESYPRVHRGRDFDFQDLRADAFRSLWQCEIVLPLSTHQHCAAIGSWQSGAAFRKDHVVADPAPAQTRLRSSRHRWPGKISGALLAVLVRQDSGAPSFSAATACAICALCGKIDAVTDFRLASFTKQFTAMAVMLLVHDGKLRYDQPLTEIFPGFPAYARAITVRHLLTHTSGLPDYEDAMDARQWTPEHQIQDEDVLALLQRQTAPKFAAGTSWAYSNSAYVLLGLIVAKASGEPFEQFLQHRIFRPLQHDRHAGLPQGQEHRAAIAPTAIRSKAGEFVETDQSSTSATLGDGGVYSNLADLAKWDAALENHTLLGETEMSAALTPVKLAGGGQPNWPAAPGGRQPESRQARGLRIRLVSRSLPRPPAHVAQRQHAGIPHRHPALPREKLTVIVLCNRTDLDAAALALQVADLFHKSPELIPSRNAFRDSRPAPSAASAAPPTPPRCPPIFSIGSSGA
jgi:CubicO group peptidase (beta-lactamase class C family)